MELINKPARLLELENLKQARFYVVPIIVFLTISYSAYLLVDVETIKRSGLVDEGGIYEYLTAIFFVLASFFFLKAYLSNKNKFLLLLAIVMFFGAGEEMSWGQREFGFTTPDVIREHNVQREFTLHNLEVLNAHTFDHELKSGFAKLITINFLYKLFWLGFGVVLPIVFAYLRPVSQLATIIRLPIPPLSIGIFFLINWILFRAIQSIAVMDGGTGLYQITEVMEAGSAFVFMSLSVFFLRNGLVTDVAKSRELQA